MVTCPACGLPVVRSLMRRIPDDDRVPSSTVRFAALVAPAQPGDDWVCADCLGAVRQTEVRSLSSESVTRGVAESLNRRTVAPH